MTLPPRQDVRETQGVLGLYVENQGRYSRPCKRCGAIVMIARINRDFNRTWAAFEPTPQIERGMNRYLFHRCGVTPEPLPDPCPQCRPGGTCNVVTCGRKRSSELMALYGTPRRDGD